MTTFRCCSGCCYIILLFVKANVVMKKSTSSLKVQCASIILQNFLKLNLNHSPIRVLTH